LVGWDPQRVIVGVVDADGRLDPRTPSTIEGYFADTEVGGVQAQVRIYNRTTPLTRFQDLEFAIYGRLYQLGRSGWGIAGLGGNGQFNRLAALDSLAGADGPWRPFALTEDQDLGLRMIRHGWQVRQEWRVGVAQQGLNRIRPLWRQRTRWAQGNLQVIRQLPSLLRLPIGLGPRIDLLWYLTMPVQQLIVALSAAASVLLAVFAGVAYLVAPLWALLLVFGLSFGSSLYGSLARYERLAVRNIPAAVVLSVVYSAYTWLLLPSLLWAWGRHLTGHGSWARTRREPVS
jgi:cellulose synthase/poly-beta-1,6-N-acetylglucosamine synthase-like glycosyltransferase